MKNSTFIIAVLIPAAALAVVGAYWIYQVVKFNPNIFWL